MKGLINAISFFEKQHVLPGMQLTIAVTLGKITLKKPYLLFQKIKAPETHEKLL